MMIYLARFTALAALLLGFFTPLASAAEPFLHLVTAKNQMEDGTVLDHPSINGRPDWQLFVAQRFGNYNPREAGVSYSAARERWLIQNDDASMPEVGLQFHVVAFPPGPAQIFSHLTTAENTKEYYTFIRHPGSDFNPAALLLVTAHNTPAKRSVGPLGVWYDGKQWSIYRQDKKPMEVGVRFNVLISPTVNLPTGTPAPLGLTRAFLHQAMPPNTRGYITRTELRDPAEFPFVIHNYRDAGPYNFHNVGVWHNATDWVILNQDTENFEMSATFNLFVFAPTAKPEVVPAIPTVAAPEVQAKVPALGWIELSNAENQAVSFKLTYLLDGQQLIFSTGPLAPTEGRRYEIPTRASRLEVRAQLEGDNPRVLLEKTFARVPNQLVDTRYQSPTP